RDCELTGLWFAVFAGRRLIDLANTLFHPPLVLALYVLLRRVVRERATAAGWALVVGLVPALVIQLQSAYIDVQASFLLLAGLAFAPRPELRRRDLLVAWLALALAVGAKQAAYLPAAVLGAVLVLRARRALAAHAAGLVLVAAMAATVLVPNALHTGNPFYPIAVKVPALGIAWPAVKGSGQRGFRGRHP